MIRIAELWFWKLWPTDFLGSKEQFHLVVAFWMLIPCFITSDLKSIKKINVSLPCALLVAKKVNRFVYQRLLSVLKNQSFRFWRNTSLNKHYLPKKRKEKITCIEKTFAVTMLSASLVLGLKLLGLLSALEVLVLINTQVQLVHDTTWSNMEEKCPYSRNLCHKALPSMAYLNAKIYTVNKADPEWHRYVYLQSY